MDIEADFLVNPLSYILGAVSFIGLFIVGWNEIRQWFCGKVGRFRAAGEQRCAAGALEQKQSNSAHPARRTSIILGLIFLGIIFSSALYVFNATTEHIEPALTLNIYLLLMFAFTMLPGGLAGMAAEAWIQATSHRPRGDLLSGLLTGMLVYLALITLIELTEIHVLLFLCGPVVTLMVYRFLPEPAG